MRHRRFLIPFNIVCHSLTANAARTSDATHKVSVSVIPSNNKTPSQTKYANYRPDIDGLRCCAVLPVVAYHAGLPGISGGFVGVDIFFVISGFLITSLVREQILSGGFTLSAFYARRARRLFPALFSMLAVSTAASWLLLVPSELEDFGESMATAAAFSSNILFWSEAGYFDGPSEFKPLLHTWSLAVEEHFYLVFPAALILLRHSSSLKLLVVVAGLTVASLALQMLYINGSPDAAFFLSPHRFWELLIGAILAIATRETNLTANIQSIREPLAIVGSALLIYSVFGFDSSTQFPGTAAILPCMGTGLIILAGTQGTSLVNRALSWRPIVSVGLISYSLYLWHWPILVFLKHFTVRPPSAIETATALIISFAFAWFSWRFIERPFHKQASERNKAAPSTHHQNRNTLVTSGVVISLFVLAGLSFDFLEGVPQRLPPEVARIAAFADDKPPERKECTGKSAAEVRATGLCTIGSLKSPAKNDPKINDEASPDFLVWGDSHAMVMIPEFARIADTKNRKGLNATRNGCAPLLGAYRPEADPDQDCVAFNAAIVETLEKTKTIETVILIARWAIYLEGTRYKHESGKPLLLVDQFTKTPTKEESVRVAQRSLQRTLNELLGLNKKVVVVTSVPEVGWDAPKVLAKSEWLGREVVIAPSFKEHQQRQRQVNAMWSRAPQEQIKFVYPDTLLCSENKCRVRIGKNPLYIDEDHLSGVGANQLAPIVSQALNRSH